MTSKIDDYLSARFQSCCLNFNHYIKKLFGEKYGIDKHLSVSLQFSTVDCILLPDRFDRERLSCQRSVIALHNYLA